MPQKIIIFVFKITPGYKAPRYAVPMDIRDFIDIIARFYLLHNIIYFFDYSRILQLCIIIRMKHLYNFFTLPLYLFHMLCLIIPCCFLRPYFG